jgi:hypothetical protein
LPHSTTCIPATTMDMVECMSRVFAILEG